MVVVCGEALIDMVRNRDGVQRAIPGGGPFNTARALARLGVPAAFLSHLADDDFGRELARLLTDDGVSLELASVGHEKTTVALAEIDGEGTAKYRFQVEGTAAPQLAPAMLPERLGLDVVALHVGTLGLVLEPMASTLGELVNREYRRRVVMLDPNIRVGLIGDDEYRRRLGAMTARSTIVKGSSVDLAWLFPGLSHREAAAELIASGVKLVAVTLGGEGAFAALRGCDVTVGAVRVDVVDTVGAGDAFGAGLLAWLHDHDKLDMELDLDRTDLQAALEYANLAAAITCSRAGADPPWKGEMVRPPI